MTNIIVLFVFSLLCVSNIYGTFIAKDFFKICNRDSSDFEVCLKSAVQDGIVKIKNGIQELNFPPIDPYRQEELKVEYKKNQVFAKVQLFNVETSGLTTSTIKAVRAKIDEDKFHLEADVFTPVINIIGKYYGQGRYATFNVDSKGDFNCTMKDVKYTMKLDGTPEVRNDGKTYVRITNYIMRPDIGNLYVQADNIFPDNTELTALANRVANQNWRLIYQELLPYAQQNWNKIGVKLANKLLLKVPIEEMFPTSE